MWPLSTNLTFSRSISPSTGVFTTFLQNVRINQNMIDFLAAGPAPNSTAAHPSLLGNATGLHTAGASNGSYQNVNNLVQPAQFIDQTAQDDRPADTSIRVYDLLLARL